MGKYRKAIAALRDDEAFLNSNAEAGRDLADSQLHHALLEHAEAVAYERATRRLVWIGLPFFAIAIAFFLFAIGYSVWTVIR